MSARRLSPLLAVCGLTAALAACGDVRELTTTREPDCVVKVDGKTVELDSAQAANAATITAVGLRRGLPERAMVVAIATAWQESKLHNIDYGDRDSVGLFQQRPSQGWGTVEEILDPKYAATKFYEKLETVSGWEEMRVTDAAQTVQRSAYPEEYEQWADYSQTMVSAFIGSADGALTCTSSADDRAERASSISTLSSALAHDWGEETIFTEGENDLSVPVNTTEDGWQYASWLVAHSDNHGVARVEFDGAVWDTETGEWTTPKSGEANPELVVATLWSPGK